MTAPRPLRASGDGAPGAVRIGEDALRNAALRAQSVFVTGALATAAVGTGWLVAKGDVKVIAAVGAIVAVLVLALRAPGPLAALLLLAMLNGVPIVNLSGRVPGGAHFQDGAAIALGGLLFAYRDPMPTVRRARLIRIAAVWSGCFVAYWIFTLGRSVLLDSIPVLQAMLYCRDFLYFALLLPLALWARFPARSSQRGAWVLLAGVIMYSIGATVVSLTGIELPWLIHPAIADPTLGVTRLYASMSSLANTALIFAAALLLSQEGRGKRVYMGALTVLLAATVLLQLGRANYLALGVAFIAGVCVYMTRYGPATAVAVRGSIVVLLTLIVALAFTGGAGGSTNAKGISVLGPAISRVESGVSDLSGSGGTVGYRETVDKNMLQVLGTSWPLGLGFLHPAAHYVPTLPLGSIRNSDTGVFNIVMTMGIVGALLLFAPVFYGLRELLRVSKPSRKDRQAPARWIVYGGVAWMVWVIASSPTSGVLFSAAGVVLAAMVFGFLGDASTSSAAEVSPYVSQRD